MMVDQNRLDAWKYGRALRDQLVDRYRTEYGKDTPPPPALIVDELLTDFLGVILRYDPLSLNIHAQTEWKDDRPLVTVNVLTPQIPGVIDADGVQNVAKFHEMVHVVRHLALLKHKPHIDLNETGPSPKIVCYRQFGDGRNSSNFYSDERFREFWAEEAGRAAAVSYSALYRSDGFQSFLSLGKQSGRKTNAERWRLLALAAKQIGVNRSALIKQLQLQGLIDIRDVSGCKMVIPTNSLLGLPLLRGGR